ncbi:hypothetical protein BDR07DRAFT_814527 [Suillus spraguei]|nr:hypothetical protein BDR07DRAFT_814527 [Suillus spraguei]
MKYGWSIVCIFIAVQAKITNQHATFLILVSARVVLSQVFENVSDSPTSRVKYVFPLPASAATRASKLKHADSRVIVGVTKEKLETTPDTLRERCA